MSVAEMKKDLIDKIATIDDDVVLQKVLAFIENIEEKENYSVSLSKNYHAIKDQYGDQFITHSNELIQ